MAAYRIVFRDGSDEEVYADAFTRAGDLLQFTISQVAGQSSSTHVVRAIQLDSVDRVDWLTAEGGAVPIDLVAANARNRRGAGRGSAPRPSVRD